MHQAEHVKLRRAEVDDAGAIASIRIRTWQHAYRGLMPDWFLDGLKLEDRTHYWRRELETLPADRRPWVALCAGRVVGFVVAGPSRDEDARANTAEIYAVYVDPDYWSTGVGRTLLDHQITFLRRHGYDEATLWVLSDNERAIRIFEKGRWRPDGAIKTEERAGFAIEERRFRLALSQAIGG